LNDDYPAYYTGLWLTPSGLWGKNWGAPDSTEMSFEKPTGRGYVVNHTEPILDSVEPLTNTN
jgi:hypothetical protein